MADEVCLKMPDFHVTLRDLLHTVNLRHATNGFTSLSKEGVLRIFFFAQKNPTASAGFEPANLGTKGQHATSRPPKPLTHGHIKWAKVKILILMELVNAGFLGFDIRVDNPPVIQGCVASSLDILQTTFRDNLFVST